MSVTDAFPVLWNAYSNMLYRIKGEIGRKMGMDGFMGHMAVTHKGSDATPGSGNCWKLLSGKGWL